jgi:hypothetical protein
MYLGLLPPNHVWAEVQKEAHILAPHLGLEEGLEEHHIVATMIHVLAVVLAVAQSLRPVFCQEAVLEALNN